MAVLSLRTRRPRGSYTTSTDSTVARELSLSLRAAYLALSKLRDAGVVVKVPRRELPSPTLRGQHYRVNPRALLHLAAWLYRLAKQAEQ